MVLFVQTDSKVTARIRPQTCEVKLMAFSIQFLLIAQKHTLKVQTIASRIRHHVVHLELFWNGFSGYKEREEDRRVDKGI